LKDSSLAQLVVNSEQLKSDQMIELLRQLVTQEQSPRALQSLFQLLIGSHNKAELQEAMTLFHTLPNVTPLEYLAIAECLKKRCKPLSQTVAPREHWLKLAAQQGEYYYLWSEQIQQHQWQQLATWSLYKMALFKSGCTYSFLMSSDLKTEYLKLKQKLTEIIDELTEEELHQAKIEAGELYRNYAEQAQQWLRCN
jgi:hypothetical protein